MIITDDISLEGARIKILDIPSGVLWSSRKSRFIGRTGKLINGGKITADGPDVVAVDFDEPHENVARLYFDELDVEILQNPTLDPDGNY